MRGTQHSFRGIESHVPCLGGKGCVEWCAYEIILSHRVRAVKGVGESCLIHSGGSDLLVVELLFALSRLPLVVSSV